MMLSFQAITEARVSYFNVREHMLNKYPDQARARKGFAIMGSVFLLFGIAMGVFKVLPMAVFGIGFGVLFMLSAFFFSHTAFKKIENILSYLGQPW